MSKIEIGQKYFTTCPTIYQCIQQGYDSVPVWGGEVVKIIGQSIWLRDNDVTDGEKIGNSVAIVNRGELCDTVAEAMRKEVRCESLICDGQS